MTTRTTDRIDKQILLNTPRARAWQAITDSREFGDWFQIKFDGPFVAGQSVRGRVTHPGYEHVSVDFVVERIEPQRYFSYRWHPNAIDPKVDYSNEPMTLVEFTLEEKPGGTLLTVSESGFEGVPIERRAEALKGNDSGWTGQVKAIEAWLRKHPVAPSR